MRDCNLLHMRGLYSVYKSLARLLFVLLVGHLGVGDEFIVALDRKIERAGGDAKCS
jgi:hypothetical protein